ncbi:hypothetical protein LEP1GSC199_2588 [Leptospira vanthielii serovar Holland str. Waz Holland = ATCC 700522]|uniref:Uncharacterized protein n=1 Tax=Leptospira vanthielii serovar Holland str. Waz Holland = ATCC 700522 TaxID=1218591 RepID=N1W184_9LEPT|nr:hypothetical protein LEP1GSC199_2588 [Leptospira vanthielii serovar Holland str. Waz Holland = ATCC 700522]
MLEISNNRFDVVYVFRYVSTNPKICAFLEALSDGLPQFNNRI